MLTTAIRHLSTAQLFLLRTAGEARRLWPLSLGETVFFGFWFCYFAIFWSLVFQLDEYGNLTAGHVNIWGDWAAHFTMGSSMAYRELIPLQGPLMIDAPLSYPFLSNWISALLIRAGLPFFTAFVLPSFIFSMTLVAAVYYFFKTLFRRSHPALIAALLFLFNGGLGVFVFLQDALNATDIGSALLNPTREYTNHEPEHIKWISVISSMIIPQRAFTLGFGWALLALTLTLINFKLFRSIANHRPRWQMSIVTGVLLGMLPLVHTHAFLSCFIILCFWLFADMLRWTKYNWRQRAGHWATLAGITSLLALPLIYLFIANQLGNQYLRWFPGWYAKEWHVNWFWFWFKNWTFVPYLALLALPILISRRKTRRHRIHWALALAPGVFLFAVPNLFQTAPWLWDNSKLLIWASVFFSYLATYGLVFIFRKRGYLSRLLQWLGELTLAFSRWMRRYTLADSRALLDEMQQRLKQIHHQDESGMAAKIDELSAWVATKKGVVAANPVLYSLPRHTARWLAVPMLLLMLASGMLDAYFTARVDLHRFGMYSKVDLELTQWAKANTPADSRWLTSTKHNHWLFNLTGRQAAITYIGWLWTHGYDYYGLEQDVKKMFRDGDIALLRKYKIDYVVIDDHARRELAANMAVFDTRFNKIKTAGEYHIYTTKHHNK